MRVRSNKCLVTKLYQKTARLEILSIKLYSRLLRRFHRDELKTETLTTLINEDKRHLALINERLAKPIKRINGLTIFYYYFLTFLFGYTFSLRMIERVENGLQQAYHNFDDDIFKSILEEENCHAELLSNILNNKKLEYVSMVVLGLNDAIVEMSATIAGLSISLKNNKLILIVALITGVSAALSMASSAFLSARHTPTLRPTKAMLLTGFTYLLTVVLLILPFLILLPLPSYYPLIMMAVVALVVIFIFNFYISVAKKERLKNNFLVMALIAIVIAGISFMIGFLVNRFIPLSNSL